jgi:hypothetical protein
VEDLAGKGLAPTTPTALHAALFSYRNDRTSHVATCTPPCDGPPRNPFLPSMDAGLTEASPTLRSNKNTTTVQDFIDF